MWRKLEADNVAALTENLSTSKRQATFAYPSNQIINSKTLRRNHWSTISWTFLNLKTSLGECQFISWKAWAEEMSGWIALFIQWTFEKSQLLWGDYLKYEEEMKFKNGNATEITFITQSIVKYKTNILLMTPFKICQQVVYIKIIMLLTFFNIDIKETTSKDDCFENWRIVN